MVSRPLRLRIESFLTWPHALLYAGQTGIALVVTFYLVEGFALGLPRWAWLPRGYALILLGDGLFFLGGVFDFAWHSLWLTVAVTDMWRYFPAVVTGAVVGEALWAWLWRDGLAGLDGDGGYWILACAVPLAQVSVYFGLMAGCYGLIAGLFAIPPGFLRGKLDTRAV